MKVKHGDNIYDIEKLSKNSEYFDILKSSSFSENTNGLVDLTHRGIIMKYVLDILTVNKFDFEISSSILIEMVPILDEFLVSEKIRWKFDFDNYWNVITSAIQTEQKETRIKIAREKQGKRCNTCYGINKWLATYDELEWDNNKIYCTCDKDIFGDRVSPREEDYY